MQYHIYHAYIHRRLDGEVRISRPQVVFATDFEDAYRKSGFILKGLRGNDRKSQYSIATIEIKDSPATECTGELMFETKEEFQLRRNS